MLCLECLRAGRGKCRW